ncbi:MAG: hypothetical protein JSU96_15445 [Acidobacteriota bacterium]|nr:MAG: hypothetical protein JSU96_15445 [Acidobacteriota bacterium]
MIESSLLKAVNVRRDWDDPVDAILQGLFLEDSKQQACQGDAEPLAPRELVGTDDLGQRLFKGSESPGLVE